jgi:hypothetical protein
MRRLRSLLGQLRRSPARPIGRAGGELLGLVPALIAGAGVFLVVAGLFYYLQPAAAAPGATPFRSESLAPVSLPSLASIEPSAGGSGNPTAAIATRIRIQGLVPPIDLPVIASPPNEELPLCGVAEYMTFDQPAAYPGLPRATYLYAHARTGMFKPLLTASEINDGAAMIGMWVEVFTDDNLRHVYQITQVLRHVSGSSALQEAASAKTDQLWLQTSEGPYEDSTKLQVVAEPIGVLAAGYADAHPTGKGTICGNAPTCKTPGGSGCKPA